MRGSVAQVGLRDFLFYVLPGAVLLLGLLALTGVGPHDLKSYLGVTSSIFGVLGAYLLGQFAYPLSYLARWTMDSRGRLARLPGEERETCMQRNEVVVITNEMHAREFMSRVVRGREAINVDRLV